MAKIKIKNLEHWWTRLLDTPPKSGEAVNNIIMTPKLYYEKAKEYYQALYEIKKDDEYYKNNPYYLVDPNIDAKDLYFMRADGRCGNLKIAVTAEDFYDFWKNDQSEKWQSDGRNNNTHPTELRPDYLGVEYVNGTSGHFVLYGGVNRYEDLYKIWKIINQDGTVELMNYENILREFDQEQYIEVIYRRGYYYHRYYPNNLYINGINYFDLTGNELKHVEKSKTTIQYRREELKRLEKKWAKERLNKNK